MGIAPPGGGIGIAAGGGIGIAAPAGGGMGIAAPDGGGMGIAAPGGIAAPEEDGGGIGIAAPAGGGGSAPLELPANCALIRSLFACREEPGLGTSLSGARCFDLYGFEAAGAGGFGTAVPSVSEFAGSSSSSSNKPCELQN